MPKFQFLATLTVNAPSEAAAQTQADHAIEDADQYLSKSYKLEIAQYQGARPSEIVFDEDPTEPEPPRYTVELTTEGWQIKDGVKNNYGGDVYGAKWEAIEEAEAANGLDDIDWLEGRGRR